MIFVPEKYQEGEIDHLIANTIAAHFVGMGLGKTAATLMALNHLIADGACRGALIVAPLRVSVFTWPEEVAKWDQFRWMKIVSLRTEEGVAAWKRGDACLYTINYESLDKFLKVNCRGRAGDNMPVDTVVWDELSKAKNPGSKRINYFVQHHRDKFGRHWGLTGTPIANSYRDVFAQIRLLDGGERFGTVFRDYQKKYFDRDDFNAYKWDLREEAAEIIEQKIADISYTLRSKDHLDIPPTTVEDIEVNLPVVAKRLYKKLAKELIILLKDSKVKAVNNAVLVNKLLQFTSGAIFAEDIDNLLAPKEDRRVVTTLHDAKLVALAKLHMREGRKPMLVATQYTHERDRICAQVPGAVAFNDRDIPKWKKGKIPLWVAHPLSISHGLNLQSGGSRVCWATLGYSKELYDQYNGRLIRKGQEEETRVFRLVCPGTIDDAAVQALSDKGETSDAFMARMAARVERLMDVA